MSSCQYVESRETILSPFQKHGNGDLVSKNIYKAWRQDDFQNYYVVPIKKWQWGSWKKVTHKYCYFFPLFSKDPVYYYP